MSCFWWSVTLYINLKWYAQRELKLLNWNQNFLFFCNVRSKSPTLNLNCLLWSLTGSVDLPKNTRKAPQNTTKTNWILHKHLNKHRKNEQMWNLYFYVYLFIINPKYWRFNQRVISQLVISSCRIKHIYMYISGIVYFICFKCIYLSFCYSWLLLYVVKSFLLKLIKTEKCIH